MTLPETHILAVHSTTQKEGSKLCQNFATLIPAVPVEITAVQIAATFLTGVTKVDMCY